LFVGVFEEVGLLLEIFDEVIVGMFDVVVLFDVC
jgi:hypothetical protein